MQNHFSKYKQTDDLSVGLTKTTEHRRMMYEYEKKITSSRCCVIQLKANNIELLPGHATSYYIAIQLSAKISNSIVASAV